MSSWATRAFSGDWRAEGLQVGDTQLIGGEASREIHIAQEIDLVHGDETIRASGMAGDEDQVVVFDACGRPTQIVVEMNGLIVFVDAEESYVEIVARVSEVIRIASKERHGEFGREDEAHIGVLFVLVEVINFARVEGDHVAAQAGRGGAFLFDGAHSRTLGLAGVSGGHCRWSRALDFGGDIFDANQHIEFEIGALGFFLACFGVEAGLHVIGPGGGELLNAVRSYVVIGEGKAVGGDKRTGTAVIEAD